MTKWSKTFFESKIEAADKLRLKAVAVTAAVTQKLPMVTVAQESFQSGGLEAPAAVPATGWQWLSSCCPVSALILLASSIAVTLSLLCPLHSPAISFIALILLQGWHSVVGFLFVCFVLWLLWDSVVDVIPLGAVMTWIKSFHCSSHTFCFTKNRGGGNAGRREKESKTWNGEVVGCF